MCLWVMRRTELVAKGLHARGLGVHGNAEGHEALDQDHDYE